MTVDGLDTRREARTVRRRVGFLFQNPDNQIVYPTVGEDLAFGLKGRVCQAGDRRVGSPQRLPASAFPASPTGWRMNCRAASARCWRSPAS